MTTHSSHAVENPVEEEEEKEEEDEDEHEHEDEHGQRRASITTAT